MKLFDKVSGFFSYRRDYTFTLASSLPFDLILVNWFFPRLSSKIEHTFP